jgi:hypothetical protein
MISHFSIPSETHTANSKPGLKIYRSINHRPKEKSKKIQRLGRQTQTKHSDRKMQKKTDSGKNGKRQTKDTQRQNSIEKDRSRDKKTKIDKVRRRKCYLLINVSALPPAGSQCLQSVLLVCPTGQTSHPGRQSNPPY